MGIDEAIAGSFLFCASVCEASSSSNAAHQGKSIHHEPIACDTTLQVIEDLSGVAWEDRFEPDRGASANDKVQEGDCLDDL